MAMLNVQPMAVGDQSPAVGLAPPSRRPSGRLKTLKAYTWPIDRWMARAAGGASQRL